jgi:hypothetical protein
MTKSEKAFLHYEFPCDNCRTNVMVHVEHAGTGFAIGMPHVSCPNPKCGKEQPYDFPGKIILLAYQVKGCWVSVPAR